MQHNYIQGYLDRSPCSRLCGVRRVEEALPFERQLLSHHFVAAVLRDMYGVHVTCVSALAGPFGLPLLEPLLATLNAANAHALQRHLYASRSLPEPAVPPGWCQVHFSHLMQPYEVDYVIRAVAEVAAHGWKLLPQYRLDSHTGGVFGGIVHPQHACMCSLFFRLSSDSLSYFF